MAMEPINLTLAVAQVETSEGDLVHAHAIKLLGFRVHLAGDGDADVVVGEELVHGGDVTGELGLAPLLFEGLDLLLGSVLFLVEGLVPGGAERWRRQSYRYCG